MRYSLIFEGKKILKEKKNLQIFKNNKKQKKNLKNKFLIRETIFKISN
jgi:hypothetical protein